MDDIKEILSDAFQIFMYAFAVFAAGLLSLTITLLILKFVFKLF